MFFYFDIGYEVLLFFCRIFYVWMKIVKNIESVMLESCFVNKEG